VIAAARREEGYLVVVAVFVMTLMISFGLAILSFTDGQTEQSRKERVHESTFNLVEAALDSQTFILGQAWPQRATTAYPASCLSTILATQPIPNRKCPSPAALSADFDQARHPDFDPSQTVWNTEVRDNVTSCVSSTPSVFYDPTVTEACPTTWDSNADQQVWVRAQAKVRDRLRTLVALVRVEPKYISLPGYAVNVGSFGVGNNGQHTIIDASGSDILIRCDPATNPPGSYCQDWNPTRNQVKPTTATENFEDSALSDADAADLEQFAELNGTHYPSCDSWNPNGAVVVVDSGNCKLNNSSPAAPGESRCCNSLASPGILIIKSGTLEMQGNIVFNGIIYLRNRKPDGSKWLSDGSSSILSISGTPTVYGGVAIDGPGRMTVGSSGNSGKSQPNIQFYPNAFDAVGAAGTAGIVQNSWREVPNPQPGL
jgi:hypothetical protein